MFHGHDQYKSVSHGSHLAWKLPKKKHKKFTFHLVDRWRLDVINNKESLFFFQKNNWFLHVTWVPPIRGLTSNWKCHLQLEISPPIGGLTSNQRCHLQSEVPSPIGGETSAWRWDLQLEISPPIGDPTSWRYFFVPSGVITILDYIKNYAAFL